MKSRHVPYRFEHFDIRIMFSDLRFSSVSKQFNSLNMKQRVKLSDGREQTLTILANGKPLIFITGSLSCPMTVSVLPFLRQVKKDFDDKFNFILIYVREAHPGEHYQQARTWEEKQQHACQFLSIHDLDISTIVDGLEGELHKQLDTKPNSLHIVDGNGSVLFQSLWSGDFVVVEQALNSIADGLTPPKRISERMMSPFMRGAGYIHQTLKQAGKRAGRELMFGAPPIWLLSRTAASFTMITPAKRGTLAMGVLLMITAAITVILL